MNVDSAGVVMVVDDNPLVLESINIGLRAHGFGVRSYGDGATALASFLAEPPDVVVTDVTMQGMDGIRLIEEIRAVNEGIPVIMVTGYADMEIALTAINLGVFKLIVKPFTAEVLVDAVEKGLSSRRLHRDEDSYRAELERTVVLRTCELADALDMHKEMNREIIARLSAAAELRYETSGKHIRRIGLYSAHIARILGLSAEFVEMIEIASTMHDIGKIGIPDAILFKPEALDDEEFKLVKMHTQIGEILLRGSAHPHLQMAAVIAQNHHEKWDGSGYPLGLKGGDIPIEGRIVLLADHYDALRSDRPYKPAFDHDTACSIILEGDAQSRPAHFDPQVLTVFRENAESFKKIFAANQGLDNQDFAGFQEIKAFLRNYYLSPHVPRGLSR